MSLDPKKLAMVRELTGGAMQAQCPACAEAGGDRKGEHLRIYPDGRYGCCVHPKDREHRKRIFALAGDTRPREFTIRLKTLSAPQPASKSVKTALAGILHAPGGSETLKKEPEETSNTDLGTLGTGIFKLRACEKEKESIEKVLKDLESDVPSVPEPAPALNEVVNTGEKLPYIKADGTLVIPFDSPERYHYWKGGMSVKATRAEAMSRKGVNNV